ncbi:hypothetical protein GCM10023331_39180 [Algivirga pacifica]|uniref:Outer membrane protein beta-barrel domain-containing protein n=2 Tax=Algivirga pacifica TaxID=1162670 RepID=A0ABP9DLA6_9BACT
MRIDAGVSLVPSAHATVSYGVTDKIAVQGYGSAVSDGYYFQAATGYYKNLKNHSVMELYGGLGYGYSSAFNSATGGHLKGDYQLYFTQVNFGKISSPKSNFETGFGLKTGLMHSSMTDEYYYESETPKSTFDTYEDNSFVLEPVGFIRTGGDKLKFSLKVGATWMHQFTNKDKALPYTPFNLGLGVNYRL